MYYLSINDAGDFIIEKRSEIIRKGENPYRKVLTPSTVEEVFAYFAKECERRNIDASELTIMSSSSIDFPEESTNKQNVIDICEALA